MSYLFIQNKGIAPEEAFTLLGATGSRGDNGLIGQFGSGAKLAICTLLRAGKKVTVYCGKTRMEFKTKTIEINDGLAPRQERQVYIQFGGLSKRKQDLGWVLGMGEMDWRENVEMAIREFVANAIDRTVKQGDVVNEAHTNGELVVSIVPEEFKRAQDGYTRIFVESCEKCEDYVDDLYRHFLHFSSTPLDKRILLKIGDRKKAQIYYNGVFVRELTDSPDSLYDYNFTGKQITIDESRNLDEYQARAAVAGLYKNADVDELAGLFSALKVHKKCLETGLDSYYLKPASWQGSTEQQKEMWQKAWERVNGNSVACSGEQGWVGDTARRKGYGLAVVEESSMLDTVKEYGIKGLDDVLDEDEWKGRDITKATPDAVLAIEKVWEWIDFTGMVNEAKCPPPFVKGFNDLSDIKSNQKGFYKPGESIVYLRNDLEGDEALEVALEEIARYVIDTTDSDLDLQDYIVKLFVRWMK